MKEKLLGATQSFSRCIIQPVMFMSIMGLVIAIAVLMQLDFMPEAVRFWGTLVKTMMDAMLNNLSLIFCIGLASALAKKKKVDAAILATIVFLMFLAVNNSWLTTHEMLEEAGKMGLSGTGQAMILGFQVTDMGVLLGMLLGCVTGFIHNKYSNVEFIDVFRAYGGSRFAFILMIPITLLLGIGICYVWPTVNAGITAMTHVMSSTGAFGTFLYGFFNRFLIPTGLHHLIWMPFQYTAIGGTAEIAGQVYAGASPIWIAELSNQASLTALDESVRFFAYGFSKVFGCIGIALAFIKTAKPENKQAVKGVVVPALSVAILAGITEPFEFTFLFISPFLWVIHSVLDGFFQALLFVCGSRTKMGQGLINLITSNIAMDPKLNKIYIFLIIGVIGIITWYVVFVFLIKKFNIKTPGREDDGVVAFATKEDVEMKKLEQKKTKETASDVEKNCELLVAGLGGVENISTVNNCFTRLRIDVGDINKVKDEIIHQVENKGIIKKGSNVQIIIGMKVQTVREDLCAYLHME